MKIPVNIPRFTAEQALYSSPHRYGTSPSMLAARVTPHQPIRLGRLCGACLPSTGMEAAGNVGHKRCCTFYCDSRYPFPCWLANCESQACGLGPWDGVFD